jgi:hypothetical protein
MLLRIVPIRYCQLKIINTPIVFTPKHGTLQSQLLLTKNPNSTIDVSKSIFNKEPVSGYTFNKEPVSGYTFNKEFVSGHIFIKSLYQDTCSAKNYGSGSGSSLLITGFLKKFKKKGTIM